MRVLSVGNMYPPHHFGGYELVWQSAVQHLRARGHEVRVVTTDTDIGTTEPDDPEAHRELRWHLRGGEFDPVGPRAAMTMARHNHGVLDRHLDQFRPDVVSWWSMGGLSLTLLESVRRRGLPAVAFVHDEWLDYGQHVDPWLRRLTGPRRRWLAPVAERVARIPARVDFAHAAKYVFVSAFTRDHALGLGLGIDVGDTGVAHSGIDPAFIAPAPERDWAWRLLYVGRLDARKGLDTAIEALTRLPPEARLSVVGGWDEQAECEFTALAERTGVRDRVLFSGQRSRDQLPAVYDAADAVVFPVRWDEPWGLVPLESMARGRPVVATGRGGSGEYLRDGENCVLFDADDAAGLARALRRLAGDPNLRASLRERGVATASEHTEPVFNAAVEHELLAALRGHTTTPPTAVVA